MKHRIFNNWTFTRALYLLMGIAVTLQSLMSQQWFGVAFGAYFASMGLLAFGCAAGKCYNENISSKSAHKINTALQNVEFEEIKSK